MLPAVQLAGAIMTEICVQSRYVRADCFVGYSRYWIVLSVCTFCTIWYSIQNSSRAVAVQPWPPGFFPLPLGDLRPPQLPLEDDERAEKWYAGWKDFFFGESLPGLRPAKGMSFKAFEPSWDKNWVFFYLMTVVMKRASFGLLGAILWKHIIYITLMYNRMFL